MILSEIFTTYRLKIQRPSADPGTPANTTIHGFRSYLTSSQSITVQAGGETMGTRSTASPAKKTAR